MKGPIVPNRPEGRTQFVCGLPCGDLAAGTGPGQTGSSFLGSGPRASMALLKPRV